MRYRKYSGNRLTRAARGRRLLGRRFPSRRGFHRMFHRSR